MPARERAELIALGAAGLLLAAFVVSFGLGLFRQVTTQDQPAGSQPARLPGVLDAPVPRGRLEVLNGSGKGGVARQATERLRAEGFDVVYFGNAAARRDSSEVIDRVGEPKIARAAADRLGIARVRTERDTTLFLDASVVLGRDWQRAGPRSGPEGRQGWWSRLKSWLGPR